MQIINKKINLIDEYAKKSSSMWSNENEEFHFISFNFSRTNTIYTTKDFRGRDIETWIHHNVQLNIKSKRTHNKYANSHILRLNY